MGVRTGLRQVSAVFTFLLNWSQLAANKFIS